MTNTCGVIYALLLVTLTGASESSITGGEESKPHSRPYMASLQIQGAHTCGGILIREDFVLTAAHCKNCYRDITVVLGAHDITQKEKTQQKIDVKKYYPHPQYTGEFEHDIMLLKLEKKARLDTFVKTIKLPQKDKKIPANINCTVAGWGKTGPKGQLSKVLKEATEKLQFSFECKNIWQNNFSSEQMICTTFDKKRGGICQGDSGGPLICDDKVEGITAFTLTDACDNPKYPHVFTKIRHFLPWIKEVIKK